MKRNTWIWWAVGGVMLILLIVLVDKVEDLLAHIDYPLDVWRMDLDDLLANVGLFLGGLGAFLMVFKVAKDAQRKAELVDSRINGGMKKLAEQHVAVATNEALEAGHYVELLSGVTKIEQQRDHCLEELDAIKEWINRRLDETGNGRSEPR